MAIISPCIDAFILAILCGNPIMKGAIVTALNAVILQIDQELTLEIAQLGRLNIVNQILNIEIQAVQAIVNKTTADVNLILAPMQAAGGSCPEISKLVGQFTTAGKTIASLQRKIYEYNKRFNLTTLQDAAIKKKQQTKKDIQAFINRIAALCP